ncbi:hypothetical protein TNCV_552021 [Trichonephila clavipes]|nr:hypothetical protein TNCV_552021 [Trichonephila clavipes]
MRLTSLYTPKRMWSQWGKYPHDDQSQVHERWLEHGTPDRKAWVRCPIPPNTLRVPTEYVLLKSVGPKVLWAVAAEITSSGDSRIFPSPPVPCLNCRSGERWCRHIYRKDLSAFLEFLRAKSQCHLNGDQG